MSYERFDDQWDRDNQHQAPGAPVFRRPPVRHGIPQGPPPAQAYDVGPDPVTPSGPSSTSPYPPKTTSTTSRKAGGDDPLQKQLEDQVNNTWSYADTRYGEAGRAIQDAYRTALGREASEDEIGSHLGYGKAIGKENIDFAVRNIVTSEEARNRYTNAQKTASTGGTTTGAGGTSTPSGGDTSTSPVTGGAYARYGTGNIPGAETVGTGGYMGQLEGFNTNAWSNTPEGYEANSIKNTFGKIASRYDVTQPDAARRVMADPEFQRFFPEARLVEHPNGDLIDFGDGKPVDVIRAATAGGQGQAWQWGVDDGGGGSASGVSAGSAAGGLDIASLVNAIGGGTDFMGAIEKLVNGDQSEIQKLIQQYLNAGKAA